LPLFVIGRRHVHTVMPLLAGYALLIVVSQVRLPPAYRWLSFMPSFWGVHVLLGDVTFADMFWLWVTHPAGWRAESHTASADLCAHRGDRCPHGHRPAAGPVSLGSGIGTGSGRTKHAGPSYGRRPS
jgi:hypothetical protein